MREQRQTERIQPFVAPCRVVGETVAISAYLTDLSEAGARISTDETPPALDTAVTLEVRIGRRPSRSRLSARVEWIRPDEAGVLFGLSFARLPPEQREALQEVVADFRRLAAELQS